jgi:hypothetical protein
LSRIPLRNEVFEKLRDAMNIPGRHGGIQMMLPAERGIEMRSDHPCGPPRGGQDLPPVRHRAIEGRFEIAPLL